MSNIFRPSGRPTLGELGKIINQIRLAIMGQEADTAKVKNTVSSILSDGAPATGIDIYRLPPTPFELVVTGLFNSIMLEWGGTEYSGHFETQIWRNEEDNLGTAVLIGTTAGAMYVDTPPDSKLATVYYYWIRFVNANVPPNYGPFNAQSGAPGSTADDPGYLLEILTGEILESHLHTSLSTPIQPVLTGQLQDDALLSRIIAWGEAVKWGTSLINEKLHRDQAVAAVDDRLSMVSATLNDVVGAAEFDPNVMYVVGDIVKYLEAIYRCAADVLALPAPLPTDTAYWTKMGDFTSLGDMVASLAIVLDDEIFTRAEGDEAEANQRLLLAAQVFGDPDDPNDGGALAAVTSDLQAWVDAESAVASDMSTLIAQFANGLASVLSDITAHVDANSATASTLSSLIGQHSGNLATLLESAKSYADTDSAAVEAITQLTAEVNNAQTGLNSKASITYVDETVADETSARATATSSLVAGIADVDALRDIFDKGADALRKAGVIRGAAAIEEERTVRTTADEAEANQRLALAAIVGENEAAIVVERTARTDGDSALALEITTLGATVDGNTALIQTEQTARADGDSALSTSITTLQATVSDNTALIQTEQTARADGDSALASNITTLGAIVDGNTAAIQTEQTARADGDSANATNITTLSAQVNNVTTGLPAAHSAIQTEQTVRADGDSANATNITTLSAQVNNATTGLPAAYSAIQTEATTRAGADGAMATQITTLQSTVGGHTTSLSTKAEATALNAVYEVKADVNGRITGYGFVASATSTEFGIRADRFWISDPSNSANVLIPFAVANGIVHIDTASIRDGTITSAKVQSLAADKIAAGTVTAAITTIGQYLRSSDSSVVLDMANKVLRMTAANGDYVQMTPGTMQFVDVSNSANNLTWSNGVLTLPHARVDTVHIEGDAVSVARSSISPWWNPARYNNNGAYNVHHTYWVNVRHSANYFLYAGMFYVGTTTSTSSLGMNIRIDDIERGNTRYYGESAISMNSYARPVWINAGMRKIEIGVLTNTGSYGGAFGIRQLLLYMIGTVR